MSGSGGSIAEQNRVNGDRHFLSEMQPTPALSPVGAVEATGSGAEIRRFALQRPLFPATLSRIPNDRLESLAPLQLTRSLLLAILCSTFNRYCSYLTITLFIRQRSSGPNDRECEDNFFIIAAVHVHD